MKNDSGARLTSIELCAGITLESKLEKICPRFDLTHALYGEQANFNLPSTDSARLPAPELYAQQ